jgi:hypothetical protein
MEKIPSRMGSDKLKPMDVTPVEMPIGYQQPTPLHQLMAKMIRDAIQAEKNEEMETFEEADDFEEEDPDTLNLQGYEFAEIQEDYVDQGAALVDPSPDPEPPREDTGDTPDPDESEPDSP